jgi:hypothetical protein
MIVKRLRLTHVISSPKHSVRTSAIREWTQDEVRAFGYRVVDLIASHLTELPGRPVFRRVPTALQLPILNR